MTDRDTGADGATESIPAGWAAVADEDTTREIVHAHGPVVVMRCDWAPRFRRPLGYRRADRPAFFLVVCAECHEMKIDSGPPGFAAKMQMAARHVAKMHSSRKPSVERPAVNGQVHAVADRRSVASSPDDCSHPADMRAVDGDFCTNCRWWIVPLGYRLFMVSMAVRYGTTGEGDTSLRVVARDEAEAERKACERSEASGLPMRGDDITELRTSVEAIPSKPPSHMSGSG